MVMADFTGRVALVTGATSGVGRATALRFGELGARVVVSGRDPGRGQAVVEAIGDLGAEALFVPADVSEPDDVRALVRATLDEYGRLDCAVNNAATAEESLGRALADVSLSDFDRLIAVNLRGVFLCMKHEIPAMLASNGGAIVNVSSVQGIVAGSWSSAYAAAKHGVLGLTRSAALEYVKRGVRINAVCPGAVRTPMLERVFQILAPGDPSGAETQCRDRIPAGRIGTPEEMASVIVWLCSEEASYMVGQAIVPDGGYTVM
jgi:NAD(P)-dependent dehydrogenase (short-subunit alcohol dehydrogenase family)